MIRQQEKNVSADTLAELKETLANMFPDKHRKTKQEEAVRRIQHTKSRSTLRRNKPKPAARHKQNSTDKLVYLKATMNFQIFLVHGYPLKCT